jgi:peroxiredoxin
MQKKYIYLALMVIVALVMLYYYNQYSRAPKVNFAALKLTDVNGQTFDFNTMKGKKLIVSFYASWCGNCIDEMRDLAKVKDIELGDVEVICISDEPIEKVISFKENHNYSYTFLKMDQNFNEIGVMSIPVNYLLNSKGEIVHEEVGAIQWDDPSTLNHMKRLLQ